jgi:hypothetical protein
MTAGAGTMPRRVYLDTSAYLAILLAEEGADRLAQSIAGAELLSSVLLVLEARRNLIRLARMGVLKPAHYEICINRTEEDIARFELRDLTLDLCVSNMLPPISTPRSLDLAHLRTASWFHAQSPIHQFLTVDTAQAQAARELGLPV